MNCIRNWKYRTWENQNSLWNTIFRCRNRKFWKSVKVAVLCVLIFIGSAFSIMVFNNDVGVDDVFARTYELLTGQPSSGYTVMELMYSVGIAVGVIVFYNHFGKKRFTDDPTPIEVQMRLYEDDVNTALAAESSRRNKTIDVD